VDKVHINENLKKESSEKDEEIDFGDDLIDIDF
jgi:hypothetical protein